jgi:hypothetical protein
MAPSAHVAWPILEETMRLRTVCSMVMGLGSLALAPLAHAEWVQHSAPEFGFSALFPKAPDKEATTENGVNMTTYSAVVDGKMCIVLSADYPYIINPDEETVASRDNFAKGVSATVGASKRITFPRGATFLEAMEFDAESDKYTFRSLIVIEGARAYMVAGGVPKPAIDTAALDACLRGFTLTPKS